MRFIFRSLDKSYACVAQLVEQLTLNQWVRGSNPRARTNLKSSPVEDFFIKRHLFLPKNN